MSELLQTVLPDTGNSSAEVQKEQGREEIAASSAVGTAEEKARGTKIHPGLNVGRGGDDTLFATADGIVRFERKGRDKKQVSVLPVEAE